MRCPVTLICVRSTGTWWFCAQIRPSYPRLLHVFMWLKNYIFLPFVHDQSTPWRRSGTLWMSTGCLKFFWSRLKPLGKLSHCSLMFLRLIWVIRCLLQPLLWSLVLVLKAYKASGLEVPKGITAHSTRSATTSEALSNRASVDEICRAATWTSLSTFVRHYKLDSAEAAFSRRVLRQVIATDGNNPPGF